MRVLVALFFMLAIADGATAAKSVRETSGVPIQAHRCTQKRDTITGSVETGPDLGGASYKLTFRGPASQYQALCDVLEVLRAKGHYASLRIADAKAVPDSATYSGILRALIVPTLGD